MRDQLAKTGIDVIGSVPWGTHFCQFYQSKGDLLDILVPYFRAGLENNEFCMWVTSAPLGASEAREAMRKAMPDFADRLARGQIEILPHTRWYLRGGTFDQQRVLDGWVNKLNEALAHGYTGLRLSGNTFWLEKPGWKSFTEYEAAINSVIGNYRMLALCTYSLDKCGAAEIMDVIRNHEFALMRKEGQWEIIESTMRTQAKQALLNSESKYRQLVESLQEGVWVIDEDTRTTFINPRMADMLGYSAEEMLGKRLFEFVDESHLAIARERMERRQQGIREVVEFQFRRKDRSPLHALVSAAPLTDHLGQFSGVIAGIVDVTERKEAEDALRESEERYRGLYQSVAGGIVVQDRNGVITEANAAAREILGLTRDEITGRTSTNPEWQAVREDGSPFGGEDHPAMVTLRTGEALRGVVMGVLHPASGERRWILINSEPIRDPVTNEVQAVATTFVDITESRRIGEELRRAHDLMEAVTEGTGVIIASQDTNHRYTYFNKPYQTEMERLTGKRLHVGDSMVDLYADMPEQQRAAVEEWSRALRGETFSQKIAFGNAAQNRTVYRVFHTPIRNLNGEVVGAGEVAFDIGQQIRIEQALREAQGRTQLLAETASELLKSDSPQLVVNNLCARVMAFLDCQVFFNFLADDSAGRLRLNACAGVSEEQAREIEWLDYGAAICGCAARDACRLVAENILETPDPRTELVKSYGIQAYACHPLMAQNRVLGTLSFGTRTRTRFTDEELSLMKAVADLVAIAMQRKQTEDTLRETGDYLDSLLNYANAPIIVWDPELRITKFNRAFQRLTGHKEAEALGQHLAMLFPEDTREKSLSHIRRTATGERWETVEIPILRVDGEVRTVLWNSANIYASDGQGPLATIAQGHDITERKRAEEQLEFQANILSHIFDAVVAVDNEGRVTYWNASAADLYGVSGQEAIGQMAESLYSIDWLNAQDERAFAESLAAKGYWTGDQFHVQKSGDRMYARVSESVIRDADGAPTGKVAVVRDRTKLWQAEQEVKLLNERLRRQAEDRLRATDASFRTAITSSADGIVVVRKDGIIRFANPAAEELLGQGSAELVGTLFSFPLVEGTEIEIPKDGGQMAFAEMRIVELDWEGSPAYLATLRDITRRKQGYVALQESETRLRLLLEQIPCVSWTLDTKMRFTSFAGSGLGVFRDTPDQVQGMTLAEYFEVTDLDFTPYVVHRRALQGTPATYELNWARRTFYGRVEPLKDADNRIVGVVGVAFDITDRKLAEEQLRSLSHRLVTTQENERRRIARELHDQVGQSLTALKLCLDKVSLSGSPGDVSGLGEARRALRELMGQVRSMSMELRPTMLDDLGLLPTLLWHCERYTAQTGVKVNFKHRGLRKDLPQDIVTAAYRIVQEALTNVARHAQVNEVQVCVRSERDALVVEVEDQGVGFDIDAVAAARMGLNGMRERALSLNGKLLVQSKPGEGTCVIAALPLAEKRKRNARSKRNDNRSSGRRSQRGKTGSAKPA